MIVDTMVFAYALLGVAEFREPAADVLAKADRIVVPDSFRAELVNVLWQWTRHRDVPVAAARSMIDDTEALIARVIPGDHLWRRALDLAAEAGHPAYDAFFVAAAELEATRVVSFDRRLKQAFPARVLTAEEYLRDRE